MKLRLLAGALIAALPASRLKNRLLSCIRGWSVAPTALVRPSLIFNVQELELEDNARIGFGTVVRNMVSVRISRDAAVGQWNWISSDRRLANEHNKATAGVFFAGEHSSVISRHHIDCSGGVHIAEFTVVAGYGTTILSHEIDFWGPVQQTREVRIGRACFIGTGATITAGVTIVNHVVIGAGSVVVNDLMEPESLYAGVPAVRKRAMPGAAYFTRTEGHVHG